MNEPHSWVTEAPLYHIDADRETLILELAIENYLVQEIAEEMNLSEAEVRQVLARFTHKLEDNF